MDRLDFLDMKILAGLRHSYPSQLARALGASPPWLHLRMKALERQFGFVIRTRAGLTPRGLLLAEIASDILVKTAKLLKEMEDEVVEANEGEDTRGGGGERGAGAETRRRDPTSTIGR